MSVSAPRVAPVILAVVLTSVAFAGDARERRLAIIPDAEPGVEALADALVDPDPLVARTAARMLPSRGIEAFTAVERALDHDDSLVRRNAAMALADLGARGLPLIERGLRDSEALVRQGAVFSLACLDPSVEVLRLLELAAADESQHVRNAVLLAFRASYRTADAISLPVEGWRFAPDPENVGTERGWFAQDFDDSGWDEIAIEQTWQEAGYDYIGVAWYRRTIELPAIEEPARVVLDFQGVDESTWVWVNGEFVGEHDVGPAGWDKPFRLDATGTLNWGGENQITVRAMNTAHAGGIWRPVSIMRLELAQ